MSDNKDIDIDKIIAHVEEINKRLEPKGPDFTWDLTPKIDFDFLQHIKVPEDRWFTDEEFREIFVYAYKLSKENIDDMIKWDKEHGYPNRFEPHHNGLSDRENKIDAIGKGRGDKVIEQNWFDYLTGNISRFEMKERNLNHVLYENREAGRKRYKKTPELLKEREDGIKNFIKNIK